VIVNIVRESTEKLKIATEMRLFSYNNKTTTTTKL